MNDTSRLPLAHAAFVIARRDFRAIVLSKAFLLFLLGPLLFIGIGATSAMLGQAAAEGSDPPRLAVALEEGDAFMAAHARLADLVDLPPAEAVAPAPPATLLADAEGNFGAVLTGTLAAPVLTGTADEIARWRGDVSLVAATARGGTPAGYPDVALIPTAASMADTRDANSATATGALTLMFLLTMLLAGMVLSNLVEEKGNKIIEILAAAIPMDAVFLGKLFAMLAVSFVGIAVWGGAIGALLLAGGAGLPAIPPPAVGWPLFVALFVLYFAMAYLLIGSVFLTVGAMAPTVRDVQTISMPATILQLGIFFLTTYAMNDPGSALELFAVIFPLSSPFAMAARAAQDAALWPHALALAWQALWVALFVRFGAALFRKVVMKSGGGAKGAGWRGLLPAGRKDRSQTATDY